MRRTYFIRCFNLTVNLLKLSILMLVVTAFNFALRFLIGKLLVVIHVPILLLVYTNGAYQYAILVTVTMACLEAGLIMGELIIRMKTDSVLNVVRATIRTEHLRQFLKQANKEQSLVTISFNKAVGKSVVDVRKDRLLVRIPIPRQQQAQKQLLDMQNQIVNDVSNSNPNFIFSNAQRSGKWLWIIGTRQ